MKFKFPELRSLFDAQQNFEQLQGTAILGMTRGTASVSWPGGNRQTNTVNVNHGLSGVPSLAGVFSTNANAAYAIVATTATHISIQGNTLDGTSPAIGTSLNVYWFAIP